MENFKDNISPTFEITSEETVMYDTPRRTKQINIIANELKKIEKKKVSIEEELRDIVDEVKRTDECPKVPAKRNFVITFPEDVLDALSTSDITPKYLTAYPHLDDFLEEQEENGYKKKKTCKPMGICCTKTLLGSLRFWRIMFLILLVTIMILIILTRKSVRNIYFTYE